MQEEAFKRSRAAMSESEFLALKFEVAGLRDRKRDVSQDIDQARASGVLSRTDVIHSEGEIQ
jgi:hypothetical protein